MPISFRILDEHALVVCTYLGEITDAILLEAWDDFYRHNSIKRGYNEISDLRQAKVTAVTSRGLRDLVALVDKYPSAVEEVHKTAIIASTDLAYGMSRLYEGISSDLPEIIKVFREPLAALEWLGVDESVLEEL